MASKRRTIPLGDGVLAGAGDVVYMGNVVNEQLGARVKIVSVARKYVHYRCVDAPRFEWMKGRTLSIHALCLLGRDPAAQADAGGVDDAPRGGVA